MVLRHVLQRLNKLASSSTSIGSTDSANALKALTVLFPARQRLLPNDHRKCAELVEGEVACHSMFTVLAARFSSLSAEDAAVVTSHAALHGLPIAAPAVPIFFRESADGFHGTWGVLTGVTQLSQSAPWDRLTSQWALDEFCEHRDRATTCCPRSSTQDAGMHFAVGYLSSNRVVPPLSSDMVTVARRADSQSSASGSAPEWNIGKMTASFVTEKSIEQSSKRLAGLLYATTASPNPALIANRSDVNGALVAGTMSLMKLLGGKDANGTLHSREEIAALGHLADAIAVRLEWENRDWGKPHKISPTSKNDFLRLLISNVVVPMTTRTVSRRSKGTRPPKVNITWPMCLDDFFRFGRLLTNPTAMRNGFVTDASMRMLVSLSSSLVEALRRQSNVEDIHHLGSVLRPWQVRGLLDLYHNIADHIGHCDDSVNVLWNALAELLKVTLASTPYVGKFAFSLPEGDAVADPQLAALRKREESAFEWALGTAELLLSIDPEGDQSYLVSAGVDLALTHFLAEAAHPMSDNECSKLLSFCQRSHNEPLQRLALQTMNDTNSGDSCCASEAVNVEEVLNSVVSILPTASQDDEALWRLYSKALCVVQFHSLVDAVGVVSAMNTTSMRSRAARVLMLSLLRKLAWRVVATTTEGLEMEPSARLVLRDMLLQHCLLTERLDRALSNF